MYKNNEIEENKKLIEDYPFLWPVDWNGNKIKDYDYKYTFLDDMPIGWKKRFGRLLCEDLKKDLKTCNYLDKYSLCQVKEKYGELRWYSNGVPQSSKESEIISKYGHISGRVCTQCGKFPVPVINNGWIQPLCKDCYEKFHPETSTKSYEDFIIDDSEFNPVLHLTRFSKDGNEEIFRDTSNIIERMKDVRI